MLLRVVASAIFRIISGQVCRISRAARYAVDEEENRLLAAWEQIYKSATALTNLRNSRPTKGYVGMNWDMK
jgi:hypothetical protein